jgi:hypothetical protein
LLFLCLPSVPWSQQDKTGYFDEMLHKYTSTAYEIERISGDVNMKMLRKISAPIMLSNT